MRFLSKQVTPLANWCNVILSSSSAGCQGWFIPCNLAGSLQLSQSILWLAKRNQLSRPRNTINSCCSAKSEGSSQRTAVVFLAVLVRVLCVFPGSSGGTCQLAEVRCRPFKGTKENVFPKRARARRCLPICTCHSGRCPGTEPLFPRCHQK